MPETGLEPALLSGRTPFLPVDPTLSTDPLELAHQGEIGLIGVRVWSGNRNLKGGQSIAATGADAATGCSPEPRASRAKRYACARRARACGIPSAKHTRASGAPLTEHVPIFRWPPCTVHAHTERRAQPQHGTGTPGGLVDLPAAHFGKNSTPSSPKPALVHLEPTDA